MKRADFLHKIKNLFLAIFALFSALSFKKILSFNLEHTSKILIPASKLSGNWQLEKYALVKKHGNEIKVLSRKCPHLGCTLQVLSEKNEIVCPCHGSRFDLDGKYLAGPAKKDMTELAYNIVDSESIEITLK